MEYIRDIDDSPLWFHWTTRPGTNINTTATPHIVFMSLYEQHGLAVMAGIRTLATIFVYFAIQVLVALVFSQIARFIRSHRQKKDKCPCIQRCGMTVEPEDDSAPSSTSPFPPITDADWEALVDALARFSIGYAQPKEPSPVCHWPSPPQVKWDRLIQPKAAPVTPPSNEYLALEDLEPLTLSGKWDARINADRTGPPPRPRNLPDRTRVKKELFPGVMLLGSPWKSLALSDLVAVEDITIPALSLDDLEPMNSNSVKQEPDKNEPFIPDFLSRIMHSYPQVHKGDRDNDTSKCPSNNKNINIVGFCNNNSKNNHKHPDHDSNPSNNNYYDHIRKDNGNMAKVLSRLEIAFAAPSEPHEPTMFLTASANPNSLTLKVPAPDHAVKRPSPHAPLPLLLTAEQTVTRQPTSDPLAIKPPAVNRMAIKLPAVAKGCIGQTVTTHPRITQPHVVQHTVKPPAAAANHAALLGRFEVGFSHYHHHHHQQAYGDNATQDHGCRYFLPSGLGL